MEALDDDFPVKHLLGCLAADSRSSSEIARLAGVSQPTVSRLRLSDGIRVRRSAPFSKLCEFYGIEYAPSRLRSAYNDLLRAAILESWDGTEEHGEALLVVIRGLKALR
ncbi:AsnC family protein [Burkholderia sp. THE68]|uniref:AsnC family protein n=1 Tax=Burkholderia sp. THE68 TaxID=758782 RepID=UPI001E4B5A3E|nr:AsnC family protein [Burkholderia sp. THE68]